MRKIDVSGKTECRTVFRLWADARSRPNGFSTIDAGTVGRAGRAEALHDDREQAGRDGQVVGGVPGAVEGLDQLGVGVGLEVVAVDVPQGPAELLEGGGVVDPPAVGLDRVAGPLDQVIDGPRRRGHADNGDIEVAPLGHGVERGKDLLVGQVAGGPEEDEGVGLRCRGAVHAAPPAEQPAAGHTTAEGGPDGWRHRPAKPAAEGSAEADRLRRSVGARAARRTVASEASE